MVDIKKDFIASYNLLLQHKKIVIPIFCSITIPLILIYLFLNLSGLNPLIREYSSLHEDFEQQKIDYLTDKNNMGQENYSTELINYLGRDSENSTYRSEFASYVKEKGYDWNRYRELINIKNFVMLISFVLIGMIVSFYFSCMAYAIIALTIKKKALTFDNVMKVSTRFLLKLLTLRIMVILIIGIPLVISIVIVAYMFFISLFLGIVSLFIFILLFLAYVIIVSLRLVFATQSMYLEEKGAINSIKHSVKMTKGHITQVLLILCVIYGITAFMSRFVGQPLSTTFWSTVLDNNVIKIAINAILVIVFLILESFIFTFEHIFMFYSYIDVDEMSETEP